MRSFLHFLFAVCLALACILSYVDGRQGTDGLSDTRDQFEDSKIARKGDHAPAKPKNRQPDPEADFNAHVNIVWGGDRQTLAERGWVIGQYMTKGVSFYGLQLLARQGDDFKETTFMPDGDQVDRWPAGAYAQLSYCADAAEGALKQAYSSCKKPNCHEEFYTVSVWGTAQGMNWVKDGVMLFACAAVSAQRPHGADSKLKCVDSNGILHCPLKVIGDFSKTMWPKDVHSLAVFGNGATSMQNLRQDIIDYAKETRQNILLPAISKKRARKPHHPGQNHGPKL